MESIPIYTNPRDQELEIVCGNKSPTLNGMGYTFFTLTPIGEMFITQEAHPYKTVLEIGSGYSNIAIEALRKNVGSFTANDLLEEHLHILITRIVKTFGVQASKRLKSLRLLCGKAPQDLPDVCMRYDAILIDKVLHFMMPDEIQELFGWVRKSLRNNGKLYITTTSPYSKTFHKLLPSYLQRRSAGDLFPGYFKDIMDHLDPTCMKNLPKFQVPEKMVLLTSFELIDLLKRVDMEVLLSSFFKTPTDSQPMWELVSEEECNMVGIIARYRA